MLAGFRIGNIDSVILKYRMSSGSISRSNLYEQFLYQRYLSKSYAIGEVVEIDAAKAYIERHKNRQRAANYNEANRRFNEILQGDRGIFLRMASIPGLVIALLRSFGYCEKVARLCLARLAALK